LNAPKVTEVAAAVIERPGEILLAQRPAGKPYPGYWEFPGGKIEPGEDALRALTRELKEELDITVTAATPWITRVYAYTHATVRLHFFRVTAWEGEPKPLEDQAIAWQRVEAPEVAPMLPANAPVLKALRLPPLLAVSNVAAMGGAGWVEAMQLAVFEDVKLIQLREKQLNRLRFQHLLERLMTRATPAGAKVVVNSDCGLWPQSDGAHLTAASLLAATARPAGEIVGGSCHDAKELAQAAALGLDYAVLGPVQETASHPGAALLGWEGFAALARGCPIPVYAIGGLTRADLGTARQHGAQGVALMRAALGTDPENRGQTPFSAKSGSVPGFQ
jgi:8-oxo-dGTP diphosphatase